MLNERSQGIRAWQRCDRAALCRAPERPRRPRRDHGHAVHLAARRDRARGGAGACRPPRGPWGQGAGALPPARAPAPPPARSRARPSSPPTPSSQREAPKSPARLQGGTSSGPLSRRYKWCKMDTWPQRQMKMIFSLAIMTTIQPMMPSNWRMTQLFSKLWELVMAEDLP